MRQDITITRGDTRAFTVTVTDSQGDPFDLTGASIHFTAGELLEKELGDGITVADPLTGVATITLEPEDTEGAPDVRCAYPYDVQIELANGNVKTPVRGLLIVLPDVTTNNGGSN